jgi:hypothetical protein
VGHRPGPAGARGVGCDSVRRMTPAGRLPFTSN